MKFPTMDEFAQNVVEKALDEYEYKGKTLREWVEIIAAFELSTNLAEVGTDCISRQIAIDALRDYLVGKRCPDDGTLTCRLIENEVINKLPPAQPMRGKWERDGHHIKCDQCGEWMCDRDREGWDIPKNYCPNCGAKMEVNNE